jgi:tRNA(Arg) A34 adenosine deaminase TadA
MPFGALLVDNKGNVIAEAENTTVKDPDITGHAETNLIRIASSKFSPEVLKNSTVYTSTEPCAMCSGAIYWSGVSRVVYGMSEEGLALMTGGDSENPTMALSATKVLNSGQRLIEVLGPLLVEEAAIVHEGYWDPSRT